jgi:hypothetical protein
MAKATTPLCGGLDAPGRGEREGGCATVGCDCARAARRLPIYVSEEVLRIAKLAPGASDTSPEELRRWLEGLNDEDLGRYKM